MGFVLHLLLALGGLIVVELGWTGGVQAPWVLVGFLVVPYGLGRVARRAYLAGRFRTGALLERLLSLGPVLMHLLALTCLGWPALLAPRGLGPQPGGWSGLGLLAGLAPYLVYELVTIDARARSLAFVRGTTGKVRAFQLRMFLAILLPFLFYVGGSTLLGRWPEVSVPIEEVGLLGVISAVAVLLGFLVAMPFLLRYAWDTARIESGWMRTTLEEVGRRAGFRCRELLVWNTGRQMSNAAIVGVGSSSRFVFFTDLLLSQLGPRELAAVFAHEMGHARRAHAVVFGAFAVGFFLGAHLLLGQLQVEDPATEAAVLVVVLLLWYLAFGYLSRRFELEADLESLRILGEGDSLVRALEQVTGAHGHERSSWRYFSTRERVDFLRRAERDPVVGLKLRLALSRWRRLGFALFLLTTVLELFALSRDWNEDWLRADLRLGRYEEALTHAPESEDTAAMVELALLGAEVPVADRTPEVLEGRARASLERGDPAEARGYLELAVLMGRTDLGPVLKALGGEDPGAELPEAWSGLADP
jgi:Zn-dependent protease with chaperone function